MNKRFSTYNQSPPDTPSLREQAFYVSNTLVRAAQDRWPVEGSAQGCAQATSQRVAQLRHRGGQLLSSHPTTAPRYCRLLLPRSQLLFSLPKSPGRAANKHGWSLLDIFRETLFEKLSQSCSCGDVSSAELGRWPQQGRVSVRAGAGQ